MREIKRLDAISRSPVYGSIGEELAGLATIRAYRAEGRLITRNADLIDRSVIFSLVNQSMNRCVPGLPHMPRVEQVGRSCLVCHSLDYTGWLVRSRKALWVWISVQASGTHVLTCIGEGSRYLSNSKTSRSAIALRWPPARPVGDGTCPMKRPLIGQMSAAVPTSRIRPGGLTPAD